MSEIAESTKFQTNKVATNVRILSRVIAMLITHLLHTTTNDQPTKNFKQRHSPAPPTFQQFLHVHTKIRQGRFSERKVARSFARLSEEMT